jgi:hypothetical protein
VLLDHARLLGFVGFGALRVFALCKDPEIGVLD